MVAIVFVAYNIAKLLHVLCASCICVTFSQPDETQSETVSHEVKVAESRIWEIFITHIIYSDKKMTPSKKSH